MKFRRFSKRRFSRKKRPHYTHKKRKFARTRGGLKKYRKFPMYTVLRYPFPDVAYLKCSCVFYAANSPQTLGAGSVVPYQFNGNNANIVVINPTGITQSCTGYLMYAQYYQLVTVLSSKIKIMIQNETSSTQDVQASCWPEVNPILNPTWSYLQSLIEVRRAKQVVVNQHSNNVLCRKWLKNYAQTHDLYGVSRQEVKDNPIYSYAPTGNTNPSFQWIWMYYLNNPYSNTAQVTLQYTTKVKVTYYCRFKTPYMTPT